MISWNQIISSDIPEIQYMMLTYTESRPLVHQGQWLAAAVQDLMQSLFICHATWTFNLKILRTESSACQAGSLSGNHSSLAHLSLIICWGHDSFLDVHFLWSVWQSPRISCQAKICFLLEPMEISCKTSNDSEYTIMRKTWAKILMSKMYWIQTKKMYKSPSSWDILSHFYYFDILTSYNIAEPV